MAGAVFHPEALRDLDDIWDFIRADSIDAADRVIADILRAAERLALSPNIGRRRSDLSSRPLRFWRVGSYLLAYAPEENPLWIVAVIHGRRSPRLMAAVLRGRDE